MCLLLSLPPTVTKAKGSDIGKPTYIYIITEFCDTVTQIDWNPSGLLMLHQVAEILGKLDLGVHCLPTAFQGGLACGYRTCMKWACCCYTSLSFLS